MSQAEDDGGLEHNRSESEVLFSNKLLIKPKEAYSALFSLGSANANAHVSTSLSKPYQLDNA